MKILINGDSFTANTQNRSSIGEKSDIADNHYSDYLAKNLNCSVINLAIPGSNNKRIFRTTIEYLLQDEIIDTIIIGFSYVSRQEIWYNGNDEDCILRNNFDNLGYNTRFDTLDRYRGKGDDDIKFLFTHKHQSPTKETIDFLTDLVSFAGFCESRNLKYILFSAPGIFDVGGLDWEYIKETAVWKSVCANNNILDLDFSIPKFAMSNGLKTTDSGHMYNDGHEQFASYLTQLLISR